MKILTVLVLGLLSFQTLWSQEGCTDPTACNFDITASIDDASCQYNLCNIDAGSAMDLIVYNLDDCISITQEMMSEPSDGLWYSFTSLSGTGMISANSDVLDISIHVYDSSSVLLYEIDSSFGTDEVLNYNGFSLSSSYLIQIQFQSFSMASEISLCVEEAIGGCMDSSACTYDSSAIIEDGSCCYDTCLTLEMFDMSGDGWNGATFTVYDENENEIADGTLESGSSNSINFCAAEGCYSISVGGGFSDYEISWTLSYQGGEIIYENGPSTGGVAMGFPVGDAVCQVDGCLDASCNNYNPYATNDDGSCICPPENDDCQNAIGIQDGDIILGSTINSNDNEGLIGTNCGIPIVGPGVWYVYNGDGDQLTIQTCNTMPTYDTRISVFEGSCGALTCVAGNDDYCGELSMVSYTSTIGVDLYILIHGPFVNWGNFQLDVSSLPCDSPANDECSNAEFLNSGETITAELCCAQADSPNECAGGVTSYGVWYYINSEDADTFDFVLDNVSGANVGMAVYEDPGNLGCDNIEAIACCPLVQGVCAGDISSLVTLTPNSNYYLLVYTNDPINCGTFDLTVTLGFLGCTDFYADNYDSNANIYDWTCTYSSPPPNDDCADAIPIVCNLTTSGSTGGALTAGPTEVLDCATFSNPGVWYTFTGTGELHNLSTCGSIEDTQVNVYISDDGTCTGVFSCAPDGFGDFLSELDDASIESGCGFFEQDDVYMDFISEIDETYYIFLSSGGTTGGHQITITCDAIVLGCMDASACNYDSTANMADGTCDFFSCLCTECEPDISHPVNMEMFDAFGDGWGGAVYEISDSFGNIVYSGDIDSAMSGIDIDNFTGNEYGNDWFCICGDGCYTISVGGGDFDSEISWILYDDFGSIISSGGAPSSYCFTLGDGMCFSGCMDSEAANYDSTATCEDGSCDYLGCTSSSACNFDPVATLDDGSCIMPDGCMDTIACNYDSMSLCDDGSCLYPSCMDSEACNYDPSAICDSGLCEYGEIVIQGTVFNDANQDGYFDEDGFDEPGLSNWQVEIVELGMSVYTNADGFYQFFDIPGGTYTLTIGNIADGWTSTTPLEVLALPSCSVQEFDFGFAGEGTSPFWLDGPCCIWSMNIHCENGFNPGLWINNTGSLPLNGTVTVSFNPILEAVPLEGNAVEPSDISSGIVTWDLDESPVGGENLLFQCHINGPGSEYMGEQFDITINVSLEDEGVEYYNNTWVLEPIVVCGYDPNDKYAAEPGYTEEHFILPDNSIEYRIRFQNTGNFAAEDITITDMLDIERLDMETFQPMFGSHSYMTCVLPDGQVDFVFEDIFLPDSASNEPGSQGYVVYRITPMEGIEAGEVINNTANIYFDSNPAIVTNTTWHTIMDCVPVPEFSVSNDQLCLGDVLTLETTSDYADEVIWFVDEEEIGDGNSIDFTAEDTGTYQIDVEVSNPLCNETSTQSVTINPLPTATFTEDGVILTASAGTSFQWYLDGNLIDGATDQTWEAVENGDYSVEVTNEFNCSDISEEITVIVIGVEELQDVSLSIYPNPIRETATLFFGELGGSYDVQIISTSGQLIRSYENITDNSLLLQKRDIAAGTYVLRVIDRLTKLSSETKVVFE